MKDLVYLDETSYLVTNHHSWAHKIPAAMVPCCNSMSDLHIQQTCVHSRMHANMCLDTKKFRHIHFSNSRWGCILYFWRYLIFNAYVHFKGTRKSVLELLRSHKRPNPFLGASHGLPFVVSLLCFVVFLHVFCFFQVVGLSQDLQERLWSLLRRGAWDCEDQRGFWDWRGYCFFSLLLMEVACGWALNIDIYAVCLYVYCRYKKRWIAQ